MIKAVFLFAAGVMLGVYGVGSGDWLSVVALGVSCVFALYVCDQESERERRKARERRRFGCE